MYEPLSLPLIIIILQLIATTHHSVSTCTCHIFILTPWNRKLITLIIIPHGREYLLASTPTYTGNCILLLGN